MIIQVIAAFAAIFTFAMALEIPKKYLINCGFIGAAGWFVYLVVLQRFGMMTANLLGAAAITLLAHFFARIKKAPVTIFLIPGFLTLVPGAGLYRSVHYFFIGNRSMGAAYLVQTLQIAGDVVHTPPPSPLHRSREPPVCHARPACTGKNGGGGLPERGKSGASGSRALHRAGRRRA